MTERLYLFDNAVSAPARIVETIEADAPIVRLDRTIFHPGTGSQRADRGTIGNSRVLAVRANHNTIDHYVDRLDGLMTGRRVDLSVDAQWRALQSAYHSAGHLIAQALIEISDEWSVPFGSHWPDRAIVACRGMGAGSERIMALVQRKVRGLIEANHRINVQVQRGTRGIRVGRLTWLRCDGTHLRYTGDILKVDLSGYESDDKYVLIRYLTYYQSRD